MHRLTCRALLVSRNGPEVVRSAPPSASILTARLQAGDMGFPQDPTPNTEPVYLGEAVARQRGRQYRREPHREQCYGRDWIRPRIRASSSVNNR